MKRQRIAAIDILRGIAIIGMVLSANIGFSSDLPAWMFHAQTPPPTHAFNPDVPGITWVDLVFPFFLFSMGAAFPFAMRRRLEDGQGTLSVVGGLVKRWFILTVFALVLGNCYALHSNVHPVWQIQVFRLAVWAAMFLALVRVKTPSTEGWKKHLAAAVNLCGVAMLVLLGFVYTGYFNQSLNRYASDIIIMILANVAIFGGLIWLLTKDSVRLRWLVLVLMAAIKAVSSHAPESLSFMPSLSGVSWFFSYKFLQYIIIAVAGSIVGDLIMSHSRSGEDIVVSDKGVMAGFAALAAVFLQLWGLFTRNVLADFIISSALAGLFFILVRKERNIWTKTVLIGFALMLIGIVFDPIDGGITKDHCNLSYLLTTGGMAAIVTGFLLMLEFRFKTKCGFVAGVGQNPMLAYTVTNFLTGPILHMTGYIAWMAALAQGSPFWGFVQGFVITLLMMCVTYVFTKLKLFWRS
ncbi:MAG: DUF5009 domain-containing protein [Bacteroidales bacterium]|nr:DUF5009 domain-containing protein [Bacteroidales bacterium]